MPQDEATPCYPRSPSGVSTLYGHGITVNCRESYGLHASSGVRFNHESPRRGLKFVTRTNTHGVARNRHGLQRELLLGNLEERRDWGFASDHVRARRLMLQRGAPADYMIATGQTHSLRKFAALAFAAGLDARDHVVGDSAYWQPTEPVPLVGDPTRAGVELGGARSMALPALVRMMVEADLRLAEDAGAVR